MNRISKPIRLCITSVAFAGLILDAGNCLQYASEGLELCFRSVIPSLFPFLVLSIYLTGNLPTGGIPILRTVGRFCRIPASAEGILLTGLLGGYPVGAQAITQAWEAGTLRKSDAARMLGFCSNAGPAFLFGILGRNVPHVWCLWLIHILSALLTGILLPGGACTNAVRSRTITITFPRSIERGTKVMASICAWVVIFRVITGMMHRWCLCALTDEFGIFITGLTELTNGCLLLEGFQPEALRFLTASVFLGFGGICVGMQTVSVTGMLGTGYYFPGKLLQSCISMTLCALVFPLLFPQTPIAFLLPTGIISTAFFAFTLHYHEKNSSIFQL